jgi:hypothetical protein
MAPQKKAAPAKKKRIVKSKILPKNPVTQAKLKPMDATKKKLTIPHTPVKNIAFKIAQTGIPEDILRMHLENLSDTKARKPKYEIGVRMLFCLADGWSLRESALLCGINEKTICMYWGNPKSEHYDETFSQIVSLGIHLSELWWTSVGRANLNNKKEFDSTLWMMNMSNRFGWTRRLDGGVVEDWTNMVKDEKSKQVNHISADSIIEASKILERIGITKAIKDAIDVEAESVEES